MEGEEEVGSGEGEDLDLKNREGSGICIGFQSRREVLPPLKQDLHLLRLSTPVRKAGVKGIQTPFTKSDYFYLAPHLWLCSPKFLFMRVHSFCQRVDHVIIEYLHPPLKTFYPWYIKLNSVLTHMPTLVPPQPVPPQLTFPSPLPKTYNKLHLSLFTMIAPPPFMVNL